MKTPVILIIFNRPELTKQVFNRIAGVKPEKLFLVADGPREGNNQDKIACRQVKKVVENISWDCEVYRNYSEENLGCGIRVASGISWVFEHVDRAIILEDDCLPDPSFFPFCEELLERYIDDNRIMTICGHNLHSDNNWTDDSYYYSKSPVTWGWATWRRAWNYYDYHIRMWEELRETEFPLGITGNENLSKYMRHHFENTFRSDPPQDFRSWDYTYTWDYQWVFNCWVQNGLSIIPDRNLISNIGFGKNATHTKDENHKYASLPVSEMEFPLKHPGHKLVNKKADSYHFQKTSAKIKNIKKKKKKNIVKKIKKIFRKTRKKLKPISER